MAHKETADKLISLTQKLFVHILSSLDGRLCSLSHLSERLLGKGASVSGGRVVGSHESSNKKVFRVIWKLNSRPRGGTLK